ncbi:MAG: TerC family protein [Verrucomicrobiaceae bacterium]|jgi:YkoY family integral membrane protein
MFPDLLAALDLFASIKEALPVILGLIVIEGLLSVDNALAIAAMASHLDEKKRALAMNIGYIGAYGFRIIALLVASWIIDNMWVKLAGALYLVWLMCAHFASQREAVGEEGEALNVHHRTFAGTITMIALMDLSLSVDNVVAAIALSPDKLWPVYVGVTIGIISLRIIAGYAVKMIEKYPILEHTAFMLVGYVGLMLLVELELHVHFDKVVKFIGIVALSGLSILYSQKPGLRAVLLPVLRVLLLPMELFAAVVGALIVVITWPFKQAIALCKGA